MNFVIPRVTTKKGENIIHADYRIFPGSDLMVRGGAFYAFWDEKLGLWNTNEIEIPGRIDEILKEAAKPFTDSEAPCRIRWLSYYDTKAWIDFQNYVRHCGDTFVNLDSTITFKSDKPNREAYASKRLSYDLNDRFPSAYNELMSTLYSPKERMKIEWALGSIFAGDSYKIQKFLVFYGDIGTGKSTVLKIIQTLLEGYCVPFEARELGQVNNQFSLECLKSNPLVAIQHDGDLSRIESNVRLNSIVSHETIVMHEKYRSSYSITPRTMLFMGSNAPVQITDARSGLRRRLIDVSPTGKKLPFEIYQQIMNQIGFEKGSIANHCLKVYKRLGRTYYDNYIPMEMVERTDYFYNFVEDNKFEFKDGVGLKRAYDMYKDYCDESGLTYKMNKQKFKYELMNYFEEFIPVAKVDGKVVSNFFRGLTVKRGDMPDDEIESWIQLEERPSLLDDILADCPAQYASSEEKPTARWDDVRTILSQLDSSRVHYVRPPENHIVIDFDLKDAEGNKSLEENLKAASLWPKTYAEVSKGGAGLHLHYIYDGDVTKLSSLYSEGIEVKVFTGKSSLRRKLTRCTDISVATISESLPLKGEKNVIDFDRVMTEKSLRSMIIRNLRKEIHPYTKPSVDFIYKILEDAYSSDLVYDVSDLKKDVMAFAASSHHQALAAIKLVNQMKFRSEQVVQEKRDEESSIVFFDCEVFPNLFLVNWKYPGEEKVCTRMINPKSSDIEELFKYRLIGFNNRRYDNHILYARYLGYSNQELYELSQRIVSGDRNAFFSDAYNVSYTDVYDFASAANKKSLKKFEIELGIHHQELGLPWDKPVDEKDWELVAEYCDNDVIATEAVFNHLRGDWAARQILSKLSGLSVNQTTNSHSAKIIFGNEKNPQQHLVYTDLSEMFPGYEYKAGKSTYRGEEVGEGGYVYAEPGIYYNVPVIDVESMHPTSIERLNLLGKFTPRFSELKNIRLMIKHKDMEGISAALDGQLKPFLNDSSISLKDVSNALKTVINSIYGLTSAHFDNPFRDRRNVDNIVAKRGALFMIDLKYAVQEKGFTVVHIKTDSIKIADATPEIEQFVRDFGKRYGYNFEIEGRYERICLVNRAVYIAVEDPEHNIWTATGAQFAEPYVFKTLFSHEPITFDDMVQVKSVSGSGAIYLDYTETSGEEDLRFVGRVGAFVPVEKNGGKLVRIDGDKVGAVTGTKDYLWMDAETARQMEHFVSIVDYRYFEDLVQDAKDSISQFGDFDLFVDLLPF